MGTGLKEYASQSENVFLFVGKAWRVDRNHQALCTPEAAQLAQVNSRISRIDGPRVTALITTFERGQRSLLVRLLNAGFVPGRWAAPRLWKRLALQKEGAVKFFAQSQTAVDHLCLAFTFEQQTPQSRDTQTETSDGGGSRVGRWRVEDSQP